MKMFDLIRTLDAELAPARCKIHLASSTRTDDPLLVFYEGGFQEWQRWQRRRNFSREFVIALIQQPSPGQWLFAGAYTSEGCEDRGDHFYYDLSLREQTQELIGRLVVSFARTGRQSYLVGERWVDVMTVSEIYAQPRQVPDFPGYRSVNIGHRELKLIMSHQVESWHAALSNVGGIYVITDTNTGQHYVGSASGGEGLWQRWSAYSANGHGGNAELRALISSADDRQNAFRYTILEISDLQANEQPVLERESYWKDILMTRVFGLNKN